MTPTTPPPGQALTAETVKLLVKGNLLRCERWNGDMFTAGREYEVVSIDANGAPVLTSDEAEAIAVYLIDQFTFVRRLASQSTAPTRGEGDNMPWKSHNPRGGGNFPPVAGDTWVEVKGSLVEPDGSPRRASDVYWGDQSDCDNPVRWYREVSAPTPPEPVASALADGEGLEVVAHRWRYITDDGVTNWMVGQHVTQAGLECESEPLVTAESAAARIASLTAEIDCLKRVHAKRLKLRAKVRDTWKDRATQAEARADRLAKALDDALIYIEALGKNIERNDVDMHLDAVERPFSFSQNMRGAFPELCAAEALREPKSGGGE